MRRNENIANLTSGYLFPEIAKRRKLFAAAHPDAKIISLGIGNTTEPLTPKVWGAMERYAAARGTKGGYTGSGDDSAGCPELRKKIAEVLYNNILSWDEVYISDGAKCDVGRIQQLFGSNVTVVVQDPAYPVYVDGSVMVGAAGSAKENGFGYNGIIYMPCTANNGFFPDDLTCIPENSVVYFCSPNNPTGAVATKEQLTNLVQAVRVKKSVIIFDAAYECFIVEKDLPRSIYEIEGAKTCAIEFCSLSKTAGFTGTRCGYTVVPFALERNGMSLHKMWLRRQTTKFNGVPYVVQRGAAAVFSKEGQEQIQQTLAYYKENAKVLAKTLDELGIWYTGGKNSPYLWLKCPNGMDSWTFFDYLLENAHVVGTPGAGFGKNGDKFFRLTAFGDKEKTIEAAERIKNLLSK